MSQDIKDFATDKVDSTIWDWLVQRLYYLDGNFDDPIPTNAYSSN